MLTFPSQFLGPCWWPSPSCLWSWSPCSIIQSVVCLQRGRTEASGDRLGLGPTEAWTRGSRLPSLGEWRKWQKAAASAGKPPALWGHTAFLAHMCGSILAKEELESWPPSWALRSASCSRSPRPSKTKWGCSQLPVGSQAVWSSGPQDVRQPFHPLLLPLL